MKRFVMLSLLLFALPLFVIAQQPGKLYYLLDTTKTSVADRLWEVSNDTPVKYYNFAFPLFLPADYLSLSYSEKANKWIAAKADLKKLHLLKLTELLKISKDMIDNVDHHFDIFLIEPYGANYQIHQVRLGRSRTTIDQVAIFPKDSVNKKR